MVEKSSPKSNIFTNCLKAFFSGGLICGAAEIYFYFLENHLTISKEQAGLLVSATLIVIAAILTGMGIYSKLGKFCGAGTIVPITGFANSMASPAVEFKKEGFILGVGAKMFAVAGPVIVYGVLTSAIVGIIYFIGSKL
jgi:stage V sporulation protein AC